jgi:hypothetical protein
VLYASPDSAQSIADQETIVTWPNLGGDEFTLVASLTEYPSGQTHWSDQKKISISASDTQSPREAKFQWTPPNKPGVYQWTVTQKLDQKPGSRLWSRIRFENAKEQHADQTIYIGKTIGESATSLTTTPPADTDQTQPGPTGNASPSWRDIGTIQPSQSSWLVIGSWLPNRLKPALQIESLQSQSYQDQLVSILPAGHSFNARLPHGGNDKLHRVILHTPDDQITKWRLIVARPGDKAPVELQTDWAQSPLLKSGSPTETDEGFREYSFVVSGTPEMQLWLTNQNESTDARFHSIRVETSDIATDDPPSITQTQRQLCMYLTDTDWFVGDIPIDQQWSPQTLRLASVLDRCRLLEQRRRAALASMILPIDSCLESDPWIALVALDTIANSSPSVASSWIHDASIKADKVARWVGSLNQPVDLVIRDPFEIDPANELGHRSAIAQWAVTHRSKLKSLTYVPSRSPGDPRLIADTSVPSAAQHKLASLRWNANSVSTQDQWLEETKSLWISEQHCIPLLPSDEVFAATKLNVPVHSRCWRENEFLTRQWFEVWSQLPSDSWKSIDSIDEGNRLVEVHQRTTDSETTVVIVNRAPWATAVDMKLMGLDATKWQVVGIDNIDRQDHEHVRIRLPVGHGIALKSPTAAGQVYNWTAVVADGIDVVEDIKSRVTKIVERLGLLGLPPVSQDQLADDFEPSADRQGESLAPWMHAQHPPGCVGLVTTDSYATGQRCVRLSANLSKPGRTWLVSPEMAIPPSGRLAVSLACRCVSDPSQIDSQNLLAQAARADGSKVVQTSSQTDAEKTMSDSSSTNSMKLRLAFEGVGRGKPVRIIREIDVPADNTWCTFPMAIQCEGITQQSVDSLRLTIDLMSTGEVHLDNIHIHQDFVASPQRANTQNQAFLAVSGLKRGNLNQCIDLFQNQDALALLWRQDASSDIEFFTTSDAGQPQSPPASAQQTGVGQSIEQDSPPSVSKRLRTWIPAPFRF